MKIKIFYISLIIFTSFLFGCQKIDIRKDGYFILKANGKRITYNGCYFNTHIDNSGSIPVYINEIIAYDRKESGDTIKAKILILFTGNTKGSFPVIDSLNSLNNGAVIYLNDKYYTSSSFPNSEWNLEIEEYTENKIIKGSLSGKFYILNDFIDVKKSDFLARVDD